MTGGIRFIPVVLLLAYIVRVQAQLILLTS